MCKSLMASHCNSNNFNNSKNSTTAANPAGPSNQDTPSSCHSVRIECNVPCGDICSTAMATLLELSLNIRGVTLERKVITDTLAAT